MELQSLVSIVSGFFTVAYLVIVCWMVVGWARLKRPGKKLICSTRVSVLIAARNEEENIAETLTAILEQDYPQELVEIIVINDHSTDNTASIVSGFDRVKLVNLAATSSTNSFKKAALSAGIAEATGTLIITTDADCVMGRSWLSSIAGCYESDGYKMISGPVGYHRARNFFERLQLLEFTYLIGMGGSAIGNKYPFTCNGANLTYERQLFEEIGGFTGIDELASGDDELLLHKVASAYPGSIGFLKDHDATVYTMAKPTLSAFIAQRRRWASKGSHYTRKWVVVSGILTWAFNLTLFLNLVAGIFYTPSLYIGSIQLLLKIIIEFIYIQPVIAFAKRSKLMILAPLLSIVHIAYLLFIAVAGNAGTYKWKGREVR